MCVIFYKYMDVYAENILDHYRNPRGKAPLPEGTSFANDRAGATVTHEEVNVSCGDSLTLSLALEDGKLTGLGWDGSGCAISQAAMSMLAEDLEGKTIDDLNALTKDDIYTMLGVPVGPRRMKCALLCLHTLKNALRKAKGHPLQGWTDTVESGQ